MKNLKYLIILFATTFQACDKVENPFPENQGTSFFINNEEIIVEPSFGLKTNPDLIEFINKDTWTDVISPDNSTERFVVLEEFTGHKCANCPRGTREITRLQGIFQDQFIPVGIHAGGFADPNSPSSSMYTMDFRVKGGHGTIYDQTFSNGGYPSGIVSRIGARSTLDTKWEADISAIAGTAPKASLKMVNHYDSSIHAVRSEITIEWKESLQETYNVQFYLLENNIEAWQLDGQTNVEFYKHKHVLRQVVNGTFGKQLKPAISGDLEKIQYIFSIDPIWNADEIEIVAFVFDSNTSSYEIIQANAAHIK